MFYVKSSFKYLGVFLLIALLAGCAQTNPNTIVGSGTTQSESRHVSGFSSIMIAGSGNVTISVTGTESLTIEADDNILHLLTSEVKHGVLELSTKPNISISTRTEPQYTVTVKNLDSLSISGSATAIINGLDADQFISSITGSGSITPSGRADTLSVNLSGSGSFNGDGLDSRAATVILTGSGKTIVNTSETLNVTNSGSGNVEYIGSPQVSVQNNGSGKVTQR